MGGLSPNARRVLEARYLQRDASERLIETFEGLCRRVAGAVAEAERELGGEAGRRVASVAIVRPSESDRPRCLFASASRAISERLGGCT